MYYTYSCIWIQYSLYFVMVVWNIIKYLYLEDKLCCTCCIGCCKCCTCCTCCTYCIWCPKKIKPEIIDEKKEGEKKEEEK